MNKKVLAPTTEEFKKLPGFPSEVRLRKGMVAVIECEQEIPCNPCETACPQRAILVGSPITNLPRLCEDLCIGCGLCVAGCPGQAIFMIDMEFTETTALVGFPYEYIPVPTEGQKVAVVNRDGEIIGDGIVKRIFNHKNTDKTNVVYVEVDRQIGEEVRSIAREY